jgi:hypothetical protein
MKLRSTSAKVYVKEFHDAPLSREEKGIVSQCRGPKMAWLENKHRFRPGAPAGWEAARLEFEHQAEHWDTPDHGETGHLIATALRAAVDIAQSGGLRCEHRGGGLPAVGLDASGPQAEVTVTQTAGVRRRRHAA